ncbi:MAG: FGGY family carbohydrate kinase, partial [Planctomycetota bacterium]
MSKRKYSLGLDYGTNSVRAVLVDVASGEELGTHVWNFETGEAGIIIDPSDHNLARQNPADYIKGIEVTVKKVLSQAAGADKDFDGEQIIGIGVDTTGSTPIPINEDGTPLALLDEFKDN